MKYRCRKRVAGARFAVSRSNSVVREPNSALPGSNSALWGSISAAPGSPVSGSAPAKPLWVLFAAQAVQMLAAQAVRSASCSMLAAELWPNSQPKLFNIEVSA